MQKQRGEEVFILQERGESANPLRHARTGRAKPNEAPLSPRRTLFFKPPARLGHVNTDDVIGWKPPVSPPEGVKNIIGRLNSTAQRE